MDFPIFLESQKITEIDAKSSQNAYVSKFPQETKEQLLRVSALTIKSTIQNYEKKGGDDTQQPPPPPHPNCRTFQPVDSPLSL